MVIAGETLHDPLRAASAKMNHNIRIRSSESFPKDGVS